MKRLLPFLFATLVAAPSLSGCTPIVAAGAAGATVGVGMAQEGGIKTAVSDKAIYLRITDLWAKKSFHMFRKLDLNVKEGRVLVAGKVPTADMRVEAIRLAWQAEGVKQVINEVTVEEGTGVSGYLTDTWITSAVKSKLLLNRDVQSINYNIDTVGGTVYVMGIAQDQAELSRVLDAARTTRFVTNVVSYARLRGEVPPGTLAQPTGTPAGYQNYNAPAPQAGGGYSGYGSNGYGGSDAVEAPVSLPPP